MRVAVSEVLTMKFKNREEYLKYRDAWRKVYKELSNEIRKAKAGRKQFAWKYQKGDTVKSRVKVGSNPNYDRDAAGRALMLGEWANRMMTNREEAKKEAERQYQAEHA